MGPGPGTPGEEPADGYVQRAVLLAELGRYDEAVAELGFALALHDNDPGGLTMLARVHLAAERPAEALSAADAALAADPGLVSPLVLRGLALVDLSRLSEAVEVAERLLKIGPVDAHAQRGAAAILADARNGQRALNAAWRGVELAPKEAQAHLVLALVATRLHLFELAERAYLEASHRDPELDQAAQDVGVLRLERRRYAAALEQAAEAATGYRTTERPAETGPSEQIRRPAETGQEKAAVPIVQPPGLEKLAAMRAGRSGRTSIDERMHRLLLIGAGYPLVGALLVAFMAAQNGAISRFFAVLVALVGAGVLWAYARKVPDLRGALRPVGDRALVLAGYAVLAAPGLILLYAVVGTPWPLVLALVAATLAFAATHRALSRN